MLTPPTKEPIVHFGQYRLDLTRQQLWCGNAAVELRPKTWEVLLYLIEHSGLLVSMEDLLDAIWPHTVVTPKALTNRIVELRRALGDDQDNPSIIQTVHRRGYRFIAEITHHTDSTAGFAMAKSAAPAAPPAHAPSPTPSKMPWFVGRQSELASFELLLLQAATGRRQLVCINGDPGLGKTTLVNRLALRAEQSDWLVAQGQCTEQSGEREPFGPMLNLLGELCSGPSAATVLPLLRRYAPCWLVQMPWLLADGELQSLRHGLVGTGTGRMLRECCALLEALSQHSPLLLILEDLHWADSATVDLLVQWAQGRTPARVLLATTMRPADAMLSEHPALAAYRRLQAQGLMKQMQLPSLTQDEVACYIEQRLGDASLATMLAGRVRPLTGGNPLYLSALLDHLMDRGSLAISNSRWQLTVAPEQLELELPEHLRALIAERFARLEAESLRLLEAASVIGMQFSMPLLEAALGLDSLQLEQACNTLVRQGLFLYAVSPASWPTGQLVSRFAFQHDVYRHALYEGIAPGQRRHWHAAVAQRLERDYGAKAAEVAGPLASAYARAGMPEVAARVLQMAAAVASERFAHDEALEALETGLRQLALLPESPKRASMEVNLNLTLHSIYCASRSSSAPRALAALDAAVLQSERSGQTLDQLRVGLASCLRYCITGDPERARRIIHPLLPMANELHPSRAALAHTYAGVADLSAGHLTNARTQFEAALELRPEPGIPMFLDVHTMAQGSLGRTLLYLGETELCEAALEATEARTRLVSVPFDLLMTLLGLADAHRLLGRFEKAHGLFDDVLRLGEQFELLFFKSRALIGKLALQPAAQRNLPELRQLTEDYLAAGEHWDVLTLLMHLAETQRAQGDKALGWATLNRALSILPKAPLHGAQVLLLKAQWLSEDGEVTLTAVEEAFEAALTMAKAQQNKWMIDRCELSRSRHLTSP